MLARKNTSACTLLRTLQLRACLAVWLFLTGSNGLPVAQAEEIFLADVGAAEQVSLGKTLQYLKDPQGSLSFTSASKSDHWQQHNTDIVNFGYTSSVYWLRFGVTNNGESKVRRLLGFTYPLLDSLQVQHTVNGVFHDQLTFGDHLPFSERLIDHRHFWIPVSLEPRDTHHFLVRIDTETSMQVPVEVVSEHALLEADQRSLLGQGLYFGVMFAMIMYNLFLYISLRDKSYLLYVGGVISISIVQATLCGYSYQWLWPKSPLLQHYHMPIAVSLSGAFVAYFSLYFLDLKSRSSTLYWGVLCLALILTINAALSPIIGYLPAVRIGVGATMLYALLGFYAGFYTWRQGFKPAGYFTGAYFVLFAGTCVIALNKFGLLPRNIYTEHAQEIGSLLEVLLLSFALADRINVLRKEKDIAQAQANEQLEIKVMQRTRALNSAMEKLEHVNELLARQSREDDLTGVFNRRSFDEYLSAEWVRAHRNNLPLALLLMDIDYFKRFNDAHGHQTGDDCLRLVAAQIATSIKRPDDRCFRYGGEEFAVLLPNTSMEGAHVVAERIRQGVELTTLKVGHELLRVTVSIGLTVVRPKELGSEELFVNNADSKLYKAKELGRNCVVS